MSNSCCRLWVGGWGALVWRRWSLVVGRCRYLMMCWGSRMRLLMLRNWCLMVDWGGFTMMCRYRSLMVNGSRSLMMHCYRCLVLNSCWCWVMGFYYRSLMVDWYRLRMIDWYLHLMVDRHRRLALDCYRRFVMSRQRHLVMHGPNSMRHRVYRSSCVRRTSWMTSTNMRSMMRSMLRGVMNRRSRINRRRMVNRMIHHCLLIWFRNLCFSNLRSNMVCNLALDRVLYDFMAM